MVVSHLICTVSLVLMRWCPKEWTGALSMGKMIAMVVQVFNFICISQFLFLNTIDSEFMTLEYKQWNCWLQTEFFVFMANILGNAMFLLVRSLMREKIVLLPSNSQVDDNTDYLESQLIPTGIFITFVAPFASLWNIKY